MKKHLLPGRNFLSYCRLLQQWTHRSARLGTQTLQAPTGPVTSFHHVIGCTPQRLSSRYLCTTVVEDPTSDQPIEFQPPQTEMQNVSTPFRTEENDPLKHGDDDLSLFYQVNQEDYRSYMEPGQWPGYKKQVKTFQESVVMVRPPALEIFNILDNVNLNHPPLRVLLYGKVGSGKTMSLSHIVHRCAKQDWLIVQVPSMLELIRYIKIKPREFAVSAFKEGRYDYTDDASAWLQYFKNQNRHYLEQMKATKDYVWSSRDSSPEGTTLLEIVDFGIARKKFASDCIGVVLKEIRHYASEKQFKVLVAVDGVNGFWKNTPLKTEDKRPIAALEVSMFHHFKRMFEPTWTNGVCVGTVCPAVDAVATLQDRSRVPYTPQYLLKKQGFEFMDPFIPVLVPEYNTKEIYNCIEYYIDRKWIQRARGHTEDGKKELVFLSNKNPLELMNICNQW